METMSGDEGRSFIASVDIPFKEKLREECRGDKV
jgi:hypothetical protein